MPRRPLTDIEARIYSQNGEDGIIATLAAALVQPARTFVEIGCGNGVENCSHLLAEQGWRGIAIDRAPKRVANYRKLAAASKWDVEVWTLHMTPAHAQAVVDAMPGPDVFIIDIDSVDWHIVRALLRNGLLPKIICAEYNALLGLKPLTVPLEGRRRGKPLWKHFYFGASVAAWRALLEPKGYRFVTVDSAGVNCFFVLESAIDAAALPDVEWLAWMDNAYHAERWGPAKKRVDRLAGLTLLEVQ